MGANNKKKFGAKVHTLSKGDWEFGSGISHSTKTTCLYIGFVKWIITIGWFNE